MSTAGRLKPRRLTAEQRHRAGVHSFLITVAFALFWVPVIIFAKLAGEVVENEPIRADVVIINAVHSIHTPAWDSFFLLITSFGQSVVVAAVGLALLAGLIYKRRFRGAALLIGGVGGAVLANLALKAVFARARPSLFNPLVSETSYSFPSGHAMVSSAFVGVIILLLWNTRYRVPAIVLGFLATFLIGVSRVYLGVHYPSDVLAGWCVGLVWAALVGSLVINRPFGLGRRLAPLTHRD